MTWIEVAHLDDMLVNEYTWESELRVNINVYHELIYPSIAYAYKHMQNRNRIIQVYITNYSYKFKTRLPLSVWDT